MIAPCENPERLGLSFRSVLLSSLTDRARKANTAQCAGKYNFAMMLEPIVGNEFELTETMNEKGPKYFAPILSGGSVTQSVYGIYE
jgi:hypothetical protein